MEEEEEEEAVIFRMGQGGRCHQRKRGAGHLQGEVQILARRQLWVIGVTNLYRCRHYGMKGFNHLQKKKRIEFLL